MSIRKKVLIYSAFCISAMFSAPALSAPEVISEAQEIKMPQVIDIEQIQGLSQEANGHRYFYVGIANLQGTEKRSLLVFGRGKILAYPFESVTDGKVRTIKFGRNISSNTFVAEFLTIPSPDNCATKQETAEFSFVEDRLEATVKSQPVEFCRRFPWYSPITGDKDQESINGKIFVADHSVPGFGKGYRDEAGVIWSRLQINDQGAHLNVSHEAAVAHCTSIGGRLPTVAEVTRFQEAFWDYGQPLQDINGNLNGYVSVPYTKASWLARHDYVAYDSMLKTIVPLLGGPLDAARPVYTQDPGVVWHAHQYYNILRRPSGMNHTVCVR